MKAGHDAIVRSWASLLEEQTIEQAKRTARCGAVSGPVALMADAHLGLGATVGSVIPTRSAIIPAAVGVDIGCGMIASELTLSAADLPDNLEPILGEWALNIPAGIGKRATRGGRRSGEWMRANPLPDAGRVSKPGKAADQLGTLGGGNHFAEMCLDENERVWVVVHSGSRGVGNELARGHIASARKLHFEEALEDSSLAYFVQGTAEFDAYVADMLWAQDYALFNRELMMDQAIRAVARATIGLGALPEGASLPIELRRIQCHHNYAALEVHSGEELWVTRKGAIRAGIGDLGIIPGSMGQRSYIVSGLGSTASYCSASHGAGRLMSRKKARRELGGSASTWHKMDGVTWQDSDADRLVDEAPAAYKPIDQVMNDQRDLVRIEHELKAVLNYKGVT
ncbi:MAG: RtcB family protein [Actinomycetia bacterium]|nr:RtcB family protein [Actinomycetes bacterium]